MYLVRNVSSILGSALLGLACAGVAKPTDQLVQTEAALRAADEVGASNVPRGQLHQTLAQEQLAKARKLMEDDENAQARDTLRRAKADAELALALARQHEAQKRTDAAEAAVTAAEQHPTSSQMQVQHDGSK